jgi:PTH1 family peptidyl-tRNA hydrolase
MNESGRALQAMTGFYKIPATSVIAVYDDLTINIGLVKVTVAGSAGGHNGVASLIERFGVGFIRYRIGIGPKDPPQMDLKDFVLGQFTSDQQHLLDKNLDHYTSGLRLVIEHGADRAMNQLNRRDSQ